MIIWACEYGKNCEPIILIKYKRDSIIYYHLVKSFCLNMPEKHSIQTNSVYVQSHKSLTKQLTSPKMN